jgi:hypothetical protein
MFKSGFQPGMATHACDPSTQEAEARGSLVLNQPGIHSTTLSGNKSKKKKKVDFVFAS